MISSALSVFGWLGNATGWTASLSQAAKTGRSGKVATLSYTSFIIGFFGDLLWLLNGMFVNSLQGMVSPVIPLAATLVIIYMFGRAMGKSKLKSAILPLAMFVSYMTIFVFGIIDLYVWKAAIPAGVTFGVSIAATASWLVASPMQLVRIIKMKSGRDLSLYMATLTVLGQIFWASYFGIRAWGYATNTVIGENGIAGSVPKLQEFLVSMISASAQIVIYSLMITFKVIYAKRNNEVLSFNFFKKEVTLNETANVHAMHLAAAKAIARHKEHLEIAKKAALEAAENNHN